MKKPILPIALVGGLLLSGGLGNHDAQAASPVNIAKQGIGEAYQWGGNDCSGFTQKVFNHLGVSLPHSSAAQANYGVPVSKDNLAPGDLVFFNTTGAGISHVGIYVGNNRMISSENEQTGVRETQIFNGGASSYWAPKYVTARRLTGGSAGAVQKPVVKSAETSQPVRSAQTSGKSTGAVQKPVVKSVQTSQPVRPAQTSGKSTGAVQKPVVKSVQTSQPVKPAKTPGSRSGAQVSQKSEPLNSAAVYTVQKGDTLSEISLSVNVSIPDLKVMNHLATDQIKEGQVLKLKGEKHAQSPVKASASSQSVKPSVSGTSKSKTAKTVSAYRKSSSHSVGKAPVQRSAKSKAASSVIPSGKKDLRTPAARGLYIVQSGDTLWAISRDRNITVSKLKRLNHLNSSLIQPGQKLSLQETHTHSVKKGDTLWAIARSHGVTVSKLMEANHLTDSMIYPNQTLTIPE
ncbi:LysM peptidoglycan-binding domain-containing protein [Sporolactobacillus sp. THM7-4]|nr:LysM peptidoglycan-binding domain-containing protein [Sporolactobacillus sp. THM7-4]